MDQPHAKAASLSAGAADLQERLSAGCAIRQHTIANNKWPAARLCLATPPQLSPLLVRPDDLVYRHLYADYRAGLAGAGADGQRLAARRGGRAAGAADPALLALRRDLRRPLAQTACAA